MPTPESQRQGGGTMKWKMGNRLVFGGFLVATAILLFVGWQSYRSTAQLAEAAQWREHTYEVLDSLDNAVAKLSDAETGQRGYLLTGDQAYLEPYRTGIKGVDQALAHLKRLTSDNPNQQKRIQTLEPLIESKLAELQRTIDLRRSNGFAAAIGVVLEGSGKQAMDEIRSVIAEMTNEETDLLAIRTRHANQSATKSAKTVVVGTLLSVSLLVLCFGLLRRELSERKKAQEALTKSEKWYSTTLASIGDAVIATDMNGAVTFLNAVAQSLTGWSLEEARGKSMDLVFNIVNAETRSPVENPVKKVFREGKVVGLADHTVLLSKNGKEFDIEDSAAPILTDTRETVGVVLVFRDITDQKLLERERSRTHTFLDSLVENLPSMIFVKDGKDLRITHVNRAYEQILGYMREEAIGKNDYDFFPKEEADFFTTVDRQVLESGTLSDVPEEPVHTKHQGIRILHTKKIPLPDASGKPQYLLGISEDITEQKQAEQERRRQQEILESILGSMADGVVVADENGKFLLFNGSAEQMLGLGATDTTPDQWSDQYGAYFPDMVTLYPPDKLPLVRAMRGERVDAVELFIRNAKVPKGRLLSITASPLKRADGGLQGGVVVMQDITERKRAEEALQTSEEKFRSLVQTANYAIVTADSHGNITDFNRGAEAIFGYSAPDVIGQPLAVLMPDRFKEPHQRGFNRYLETGEAHVIGKTVELAAKRKDETEFPIELSLSNWKTSAGTFFTGVLSDITERKQAEALMIHAKEEAERASKFKDQFLSTMSHELRTPLNAVLGFSDLLADERYGPLNDRQQRYVSHIHTGGKHLLRLISDILDLSKIEAGRMELSREHVAVAPAFSEVISALYPLAEKKSQELLQQVEENLYIHADAMRFKQVLTNLVGNAIKFTPEGGRIELSARPVDDQVRVEVRDSGPGIPPEQQQRIFEAFVRLTQTGNSTEGTGLGLAITSRLVELHGSKLGIESQPGAGACFYFSLPIIATTVQQPTRASMAMSRAHKAPRILVIEDNPATGQLIQSQLTSSGYEALRCDKPERATEVAAELQPDAITLDLLMKPIHGLEVLLQLKNDSRTSKIPVIVVTIVDQPAIGSALGADEYLIKPVDKSTLLSAVERCLHSRGGAAPARSILVVEDDVSTLEMIVELLRGYGYAVRTAADGDQARASVAQSLPELVILDLVLPKMSGFELLAEWRSNPRTSDLSVFVLTSKDLTKEEEKYIHAHAESLFRKQSPWREALVKQLERVVTSPSLENA